MRFRFDSFRFDSIPFQFVSILMAVVIQGITYDSICKPDTCVVAQSEWNRLPFAIYNLQNRYVAPSLNVNQCKPRERDSNSESVTA